MFDRKQGTISLNNESFHLEHQQAKILNLLIENKDTVVSREQIAEQVWQGVIVEDNTISKAITRLRKVLNDSAKKSLIIKTIPKKGYQFIAELDDISHDIESKVVLDAPNKMQVWYKLGAILLACITLFFLLTQSQTPNNQAQTTEPASIPQPISFREGIELNAHLHANKKKLVFVGNDGGSYSIFIKDIGDANARLLTQVSTRLVYPKWLESEGTAFVFSDIDERGQCQIYRIESVNVPNKDIMATCLSDSPVEVFVNQHLNSIIWSDNAGSWQQDLYNGKRKSLPYPVQKISFQMPSPNGQLWATLKNVGDQSILAVYDMDSQKLILEQQLPYTISHFKWSKASDALYHLGEHPANQLFQLSLQGEHKILASTSVGTMTSISDVQSKKTIEFVISSVDLDVHQVSSDEETKRINSPFADYNPVLSPLSNKLAFASKRTGSAQIWLESEDSSLAQISQFERASYIYEIAWSPDESRLLVKRNDSVHIIDVTSKQEWILPLAAQDKVNWQWVSDEHIAYVDQVSHSLFSYELKGRHSALLLASVGRAQFDDEYWFISDVSGDLLFQYDTHFSDKKLISSQLNKRQWIVRAGQLHVVNSTKGKPMNLVTLSDEGEQLVVSGSFNPHSIRTTNQGTLVFHRMTRNETNIYQLHIR